MIAGELPELLAGLAAHEDASPEGPGGTPPGRPRGPGRVLVLDADPAFAANLARLLRLHAFEADVLTSVDGPGPGRPPDVVLLDAALVASRRGEGETPQAAGLRALEAVRGRWPRALTVLLSTAPTLEIALLALREGAYDLLRKPVSEEELLAALDRAFERLRLEAARRELQQALVLGQSRLAEAERIARLGHWEWDIGSGRLVVSDEAYRLFGYEPGGIEADAETFRRHVPRSELGRLDAALQGALRGEQPYEVEFPIRTRGGEERVIHARGEVVPGPDGRAIRMQGVFQDVTERRRLEARAREQERSLLQANRLAALGVLVSGVGHEVNNPNNLIMLNAELLSRVLADAIPLLDRLLAGEESGAGAATEREPRLGGLPWAELRVGLPQLLEDILAAAARIRRIVDDLHTFARPGVAPEQMREVSLNRVVRGAVRLLRHPIRSATAHFSLALAPDLPRVLGDPGRLEQVVVNLVLNAIRALPDRRCAIRVGTAFERDTGTVVLEVSDQGVGIPPEHLDRIFDPFFTTREHEGGAGLGLAIAHRLVRDHDGELEVESTPGVGTTLRVCLPAGPRAGSAPPALASPAA